MSRQLSASDDQPVLQLNTTVSGQLDPGTASDVIGELELAALSQFVRPPGDGDGDGDTSWWQSSLASKDALLEPTIDVRLVFIVAGGAGGGGGGAAVPPSLEGPLSSAELADVLGWVEERFPVRDDGEGVPGPPEETDDDDGDQAPGSPDRLQGIARGLPDHHAIIAGSAVGGVVAVLAIAGGVWCHVVRRRWLKQQQDHSLKRKKLARTATQRRRALRVSSSSDESVDGGAAATQNKVGGTAASSKRLRLQQKRFAAEQRVAPETAVAAGDDGGCSEKTGCKVRHESPPRRPVVPTVNSWGLDQNAPVGVKQCKERPAYAHAPPRRSESYEARESKQGPDDDGFEFEETDLGETSSPHGGSEGAQGPAAGRKSDVASPHVLQGHSEDMTHHL